MNNKIIYLLILIILISNKTFTQTKHEIAVVTAVEELRKAMISGDKAMLDKYTSDKLSYGHSGGKVEGKESYVHSISSGASDFVTIELTEQSVSVSGKTAIVRHKLSATTNDGGKPGTVKLAVLLVWQKVSGQWKLLARQAVKLV